MKRPRVTQFAAAAGIDGAVFFSLLTKAWQAGAGFVSLLLLVRSLSPKEQGIYYTFNSVLALQIFFELGFSYVIMQFASHERASTYWTKKRLLVGDPIARSRVGSLIGLAAKWYTCGAFGLILLIIPTGIVLFNSKGSELGNANWFAPWVLLGCFSAGSLVSTPFFAILEGLGLVKEVAGFRAGQEVLCGVLLWGALYCGMGLYSAAIYQGGRFFCGVGWLGARYCSFFLGSVRSRHEGSTVDWKTEIWPLQWRISVSWISGYLVNQLFIPVAFALEGPVVAGRLGMSLSVVSGLSAAALAWMTTKAPRFGALVAHKDYIGLDALFRHTLQRCICASVLGASGLVIGSVVLQHSGYSLGSRLLDPADLTLLLLAILGSIVMTCEAIYLRSHKQEPFLVLSVVNGVLTCLSVVVLGRFWGVTGMLAGYCVTMVLGGVVWGTSIFINKRRLWHIPSSI